MLSIFIRTILIYLILSLILKIMGKRQIGELEVGELVSTLLISEIASVPVTDPNIPLANALVPLLFIAFLEILLSGLKNKSSKLKRLMEGEPCFLVYQGKLKQQALIDNRISINELLTEMRTQGIGDLAEVYYAILEQNGKLSLLKNQDAEKTAHSLIIDGQIDTAALSRLGYDLNWIKKKLKENGLKKEDVFLLTATDGGIINIIRKEVK